MGEPGSQNGPSILASSSTGPKEKRKGKTIHTTESLILAQDER